MTEPEHDGLLALERMERAVEKVRDRLLRSTGALEAAGIPYAVVGGNAVMAWVEQVDESAVRFTQDVDIVLRREDLARATAALATPRKGANASGCRSDSSSSPRPISAPIPASR